MTTTDYFDWTASYSRNKDDKGAIQRLYDSNLPDEPRSKDKTVTRKAIDRFNNSDTTRLTRMHNEIVPSQQHLKLKVLKSSESFCILCHCYRHIGTELRRMVIQFANDTTCRCSPLLMCLYAVNQACFRT